MIQRDNDVRIEVSARAETPQVAAGGEDDDNRGVAENSAVFVNKKLAIAAVPDKKSEPSNMSESVEIRRPTARLAGAHGGRVGRLADRHRLGAVRSHTLGFEAPQRGASIGRKKTPSTQSLCMPTFEQIGPVLIQVASNAA